MASYHSQNKIQTAHLVPFHLLPTSICNFTYYVHPRWPFSVLIQETQSCLSNFAFTFITTWNNTPQVLNAHPVSLLKCQIKCLVFRKGFANHTTCRSLLIPQTLLSPHCIPTSWSEIVFFISLHIASLFPLGYKPHKSRNLAWSTHHYVLMTWTVLGTLFNKRLLNAWIYIRLLNREE